MYYVKRPNPGCLRRARKQRFSSPFSTSPSYSIFLLPSEHCSPRTSLTPLPFKLTLNSRLPLASRLATEQPVNRTETSPYTIFHAFLFYTCHSVRCTVHILNAHFRVPYAQEISARLFSIQNVLGIHHYERLKAYDTPSRHRF